MASAISNSDTMTLLKAVKTSAIVLLVLLIILLSVSFLPYGSDGTHEKVSNTIKDITGKTSGSAKVIASSVNTQDNPAYSWSGKIISVAETRSRFISKGKSFFKRLFR